jgi:hypothetical protein
MLNRLRALYEQLGGETDEVQLSRRRPESLLRLVGATGYPRPSAFRDEQTRPRLDGLRGIAALAVVCMHVWLYGHANDGTASRSGLLDYAAVELRLALLLFFVLSGYLLYHPFARAARGDNAPVALGRYAVRRAARIVPAYYSRSSGRS